MKFGGKKTKKGKRERKKVNNSSPQKKIIKIIKKLIYQSLFSIPIFIKSIVTSFIKSLDPRKIDIIKLQ